MTMSSGSGPFPCSSCSTSQRPRARKQRVQSDSVHPRSTFATAQSPFGPGKMAPLFSGAPLALLLVGLALLQTACALPRPERSVHSRVPVGSVFTLDTAPSERAEQPQGFPTWARLNETSGQIYGIPQVKNAGQYQIPLKGGTVPVEVGEVNEDPCGEKAETTWLEIVYERRLSEVSVEEQLETVHTLLGILEGVKLADLRVLPRGYLHKYRTVTDIIHPLDEDQARGGDDRMAFSLNISCGELTDQASEIINAAAENGLAFQVVQGHLAPGVTAQSQPAVKPLIPSSSGKEPEQAQEPGSSSTSTTVVLLVVFVLLLVVVVLLAAFWVMVRRAKAKREKHAETAANGKTSNGKEQQQQSAAAALNSPATATTPMLDKEEGKS